MGDSEISDETVMETNNVESASTPNPLISNGLEGFLAFE
jgi:hypothetical protein